MSFHSISAPQAPQQGRLDTGHLAMTYTALAILATLGALPAVPRPQGQPQPEGITINASSRKLEDAGSRGDGERPRGPEQQTAESPPVRAETHHRLVHSEATGKPVAGAGDGGGPEGNGGRDSASQSGRDSATGSRSAAVKCSESAAALSDPLQRLAVGDKGFGSLRGVGPGVAAFAATATETEGDDESAQLGRRPGGEETAEGGAAEAPAAVGEGGVSRADGRRMQSATEAETQRLRSSAIAAGLTETQLADGR